MAERDSYPAGTPTWIDLGSPDPDASAAFYSALFGWSIEDAGPDAGGYRMWTMRGRFIAGLGPADDASGPPRWTTYFAVDDADTTAKAVEQAGGTVVVAPFDVLTAGRMAVFTDPAGVPFSVWQAGQHHGSGVRDEPGSVSWNELMVRDIDAAQRFYGSVFGWRCEGVDMGGGLTYHLWKLADTDASTDSNVGGAAHMQGEMWTDDAPQQWMVYFEVADCDASAAKVTELGGSLDLEPTDIPSVGRFAMCRGPQGEAFAIITSAPADEVQNPA